MAAVAVFLCGAAFCFAQEKEANRSLHPEVFKLFRSVSAEISYQTIKPMNPTLGEFQLRQVTGQLGDELMVKYEEAFTATAAEAERILAGEFDDAKNRETIDRCIEGFSKLNVQLPQPIVYLIDQYNESLRQVPGDSFSGLEAEFTARFFKEYLRQNQGL